MIPQPIRRRIPVISDRNRGIQHLVLICQCVLVTVAFWIWLWLCYFSPVDRQVIARYFVYNVFLILGLLMGFRTRQPTIGLHNLGFEEAARRFFRQLGATLFYLLIYVVAAKDERISRLFLFSFVPLLYLILFTTNRDLPTLIGHFAFRRRQELKVVLLGPKHKALAVKGWLDQNKHLGLEVLGLLTEDADAAIRHEPEHTDQRTTKRPAYSDSHHWPSATGSSGMQTMTAVASATIPSIKASNSSRWAEAEGQQAPFVEGVVIPDTSGELAARNWPANSTGTTRPEPDDSLRILGSPDDLEKVLAGPGMMKVIMVEFPRGNGTMRHYTDLCDARGVRLLVVADIDQIFGHPVALFEDHGLCLISLREEPLENPVNRLFKRCLDLAISVAVVVFILPPLILLVWILHRLHSPGPLFFLQPREGFRNKIFRILKFRTMHVGDPANDKLPSSESDPRFFRGGRFLRKTSLDEIPQFWNVLIGDMSVVGPRPHLASYNQQYRQFCFRAYVRTFVKPGITGLAQAKGLRGSADTPQDIACRMESDIEYLENWSIWLDCWLILRTAVQMIIPPKTAV